MPRLKFTARSVEAIVAPPAGQVDYFDTETPGFGLRVSYGGRKAWVAMYRYNGTKRRMTIGTYPRWSLADARAEGLAVLRKAESGKDPASEKIESRAAETIDGLIGLFIEKYAKPNKRSWAKDDAILKREVAPKLGRRKLGDVTRRDIREIIDGIAERAPIRANRTLEVIRKMFNWAVSKDLCAANPCLGLSKPSEERTRDRVLSEDELRKLWQAIDKDEEARAQACFKLLLLTGQREMEVVGMRWPDLDLDAGIWEIPGDMVKNGVTHRVPLSAPALALLKDLHDKRKSDFVFSQADGTKPVARSFVERRIKTLRTATGLADIRVHDFRRSVATHLSGMGISRLVVKRVLNHVDPDVTGVYDRYRYDSEKRAALDAWGTRLQAIIAGGDQPGNVVTFPAQRA